MSRLSRLGDERVAEAPGCSLLERACSNPRIVPQEVRVVVLLAVVLLGALGTMALRKMFVLLREWAPAVVQTRQPVSLGYAWCSSWTVSSLLLLETNPSFSFSVVLNNNKRYLSGLFTTGLTALFCSVSSPRMMSRGAGPWSF